MKKVGLIGYGYWGKILHQKLKHLSDVKFICTSKDDYHSKLEDVDWVFVVTTNQSHYQIVKDCILAGKNVFCEKPLTPTYKKSLELCELAKQHNVKLFIDEVFWYRSELIDIHHLFSHRPKELKCTWEKYGRSDYRNYVPASFHNLMYHDLYLLQIYLKDKELKSIDVIDKTNRLHFKAKFDDVVVNYGQLRLSAQNLTFIQTKNSTNFNHLTFSASGPIIISNKNDFIYGDKALYIGQKQELTITGNVSLNQNNNKIIGDKLILDLENGLARISGSVKKIINSTGKN